MKRSTAKKLEGIGITHELIKGGRGLNKYQLVKRVNHKKRIIKTARTQGLTIDKALDLYKEKKLK